MLNYNIDDRVWLKSEIEHYCESLANLKHSELYNRPYKSLIDDMIIINTVANKYLKDGYEHLEILKPYIKPYFSREDISFNDTIKNSIEDYITDFIKLNIDKVAYNFICNNIEKSIKYADMPKVTLDTTPQELLDIFNEGNKVASGLSNQLAMPIGTEFTVEGISGIYKLTDDGITQYGYLISQQQLLYILYGGVKLEKL